jgi:hypothetical protein
VAAPIEKRLIPRPGTYNTSRNVPSSFAPSTSVMTSMFPIPRVCSSTPPIPLIFHVPVGIILKVVKK